MICHHKIYFYYQYLWLAVIRNTIITLVTEDIIITFTVKWQSNIYYKLIHLLAKKNTFPYSKPIYIPFWMVTILVFVLYWKILKIFITFQVSKLLLNPPKKIIYSLILWLKMLASDLFINIYSQEHDGYQYCKNFEVNYLIFNLPLR